jgi:D-arabinose 1-dehydrogenase-like Zn-dependent alcohol dehydrogenase
MRSVQVSKPKGSLEIVEKDIPEPGARQVRIKVQACGVCHSDSFTKEGLFPGIQYPRVPGHEIAGVIDEVGKEVSQWQPKQRVAVGWHGGHCGHCESCRRGDFVTCKYAQVPGISYDGGYADYMIAPMEALALIPEQLSAIETAPLMCAGITTYNALRNSGARVGDTVAIFGMGGLGHLGIQFAAKMGFNTVAIGRARDKEEELMKNLAKKAEKCYQFETGNTDSNFIQFGYWDSLRKGLLSAEQLSVDHRRLESAYLEQNKREYEITKTISLALTDLQALINLREKGEFKLSREAR